MEDTFLEYLWFPPYLSFLKGHNNCFLYLMRETSTITSGISYNDYTTKVQKAFAKIHIHVTGIHQFDDPKQAIATAEAIFTGGGKLPLSWSIKESIKTTWSKF